MAVSVFPFLWTFWMKLSEIVSNLRGCYFVTARLASARAIGQHLFAMTGAPESLRLTQTPGNLADVVEGLRAFFEPVSEFSRGSPQDFGDTSGNTFSPISMQNSATKCSEVYPSK
jgi:hypothetical protein